MKDKNITQITAQTKNKAPGSMGLIIVLSCIAAALVLVIAAIVIYLVGVKPNTDNSSNKATVSSSENKISSVADSNEETASETDNSSDKTSSDTASNSSGNSSVNVGNSQITFAETLPQTKKSSTPQVTKVAQVANDIFVITGTCSADTEYILVSGEGVDKTEIIPTKVKNNSSFFGQVNVKSGLSYASFSIQAKEKGLSLSEEVSRIVYKASDMQNLMSMNEYTPFFGTKGRIHYYSALLSYSLSDAVSDTMKVKGNYHISNVVNAAKAVNSEVIYLVIPSSAEIYPETIPEGFPKAQGESVYEAFEAVAAQSGAKVIYPLDTMLKHKNDGEGYEIYLNTDSHWSPYGAYWGLYDLMNYISVKYPAAKPRTVSQMGFYTAELCGGDAFFTYSSRGLFESDRSTGITVNTGIKELTALYTKAMPTNTLTASYKNGRSVDIYGAKAGYADTVNNPNGAGLPTAMILRDSFGVTAFDMFNDRFSTVWWSAHGEIQYTAAVADAISTNKPNYVIYIISERNLTKILENNKSLSLTALVK